MARELELSTLPDDLSPEDLSPGVEEEQRLRAQVLELSRKISAFAEGRSHRIEDVEEARKMAAAIKPYVDRLIALKRLLDPIDRIIEKREKIEELQAGLAEDVARVEDLSSDAAGEISEPLLTELRSEIALVKRDRKLFVREVDETEAESPSSAPQKSGAPALLDLDLAQRLEKILGRRFVSPSRLEEILGIAFPESDLAVCDQLLRKVWAAIFESEKFRPHVERNRIKTLRKTFEDYALVFRIPSLHRPPDEEIPCTLENLRKRFSAFFLDVPDRALWYSRLPFYREPIDRPHWAFVDRQYLNCTFKKPSIRLLMYARANDLPAKMVRQKSVTEEVYDRIVLELSLKERFFASCNSITSTTYQQGENAPVKQVYVYCRDDCIRISGKRGTPHWRPTRPRWPGVFPAIVFAAEGRR